MSKLGSPKMLRCEKTEPIFPMSLLQIFIRYNLYTVKCSERLIKLHLSALRHTYHPRGMANTVRMRTTISPGQWQPWTVVSPLLGLSMA